MSDILNTISSYIAPPLLRKIVNDPTLSDKYIEDQFPAAVLFADISGFTPLTEALAQKGSEGSEELTRLLNNTFSKLISLIESHAGEVVKFAGDAITVIFPAVEEPLGYATRRALQAAEAIQDEMKIYSRLQTSAGEISLALKVGIGAGDIKAMQIGGVFNRWEYVIAGDPVRQFAEAEKKAAKGEIVLSPEAVSVIINHSLKPKNIQKINWEIVKNREGFQEILSQCLPRIVYGWLKEGLREWLAVLRPMTVFFVGIGGIDYNDKDAVLHLHEFFKKTQVTIYKYEGSINKLAIDDKGTVVLALFGAPPLAHQDDPLRAIQCAMEMLTVADEAGLRLGIGISTGWVFAGPVGGETRREYTVMGDTVNLCARLMSLAGKGRILCDINTYRQTSNEIIFDKLESVKIKGKAGVLDIYQPTSSQTPQKTLVEDAFSILVGREKESHYLYETFDSVKNKISKTIILEGETGIGKSRLLKDFFSYLNNEGADYFFGEGQSIEQYTPYRAWRSVISHFFGVENMLGKQEQQNHIRGMVTTIAPEQLDRLPLLNDILDIGFPETSLTVNLDPDLHKQSLGLLIITLLRSKAKEIPLIIVFDDAHWLDSVSWELLIQTSRAFSASGDPLLLIISTRPMYDSANSSFLTSIANMLKTEKLILERLSTSDISKLANARLGLNENILPDHIQSLIADRADGNPFFAEELVLTLRDQGLIRIELDPARVGQPFPNKCYIEEEIEEKLLQLPDTVQGLILSRIDRLPPERQMVLKIGAVIGRSFLLTPLHHALKIYTTINEIAIKSHLDALNTLDLTDLVDLEPDLNYIFKHIATQEVAYQTLLFSQRRQLHKTVAEWYEAKYGGDDFQNSGNQPAGLAPYYPLLVHHYRFAEEPEKERFYAKLAGDQAANQFANDAAITYYSRALELTSDEDIDSQFDLLIAREKVFDLIGHREQQSLDIKQLEQFAKRIGSDKKIAKIALLKADLAEATGKFPDVIYAVEEALSLDKGDSWKEIKGECFYRWGTALWRMGQTDEAKEQLNQAINFSDENSRIKADAQRILGNLWAFKDANKAKDYYLDTIRIYRMLGDLRGESQVLNNLGIISRFTNDYTRSINYYEDSFNLAEKLGDRRGEFRGLANLGVVHAVNLGNYLEGKNYYERALAVAYEIGDRHGAGIQLNNLSLLSHNLNDNISAQNYSLEALEISKSLGDKTNEGFAWLFLGYALSGLGKLEEARDAYQTAFDLRSDQGKTLSSLAMEPLAGLAEVDHQLGETKKAQDNVNKILQYLKDNTLEGAEEPLRVYLLCYKILKINKDPRTGEILEAMYQQLMEKANKIADKELQVSFLTNVHIHREILSFWEESNDQTGEHTTILRSNS